MLDDLNYGSRNSTKGPTYLLDVKNIKTAVGFVCVDGFTVRHLQRGGHRQLTEAQIREALSVGRFEEVAATKSGWKGKAALNRIFLCLIGAATFVVVLKQVDKSRDLRFVTAYPAREKQVAQLRGGMATADLSS